MCKAFTQASLTPHPHLTALRNPTDVVPDTRHSDDAAAMVAAVLVDTVRCQVRYGAVPVRWWWVDNVNTRCFAAAERSMYYNIQCIEKNIHIHTDKHHKRYTAVRGNLYTRIQQCCTHLCIR